MYWGRRMIISSPLTQECEGKWSTSAWADNLKYVGQPASSIIVVMIDDDVVCVKTLKMQEAYDARGGEF